MRFIKFLLCGRIRHAPIAYVYRRFDDFISSISIVSLFGILVSLVFSVYLVGACVWVQASFLVVMLSIIVLLVIRKTNIDRIKESQMVDKLTEIEESTHRKIEEKIEESDRRLDSRIAQFQNIVLRTFDRILDLQHRSLESTDPSYKRPGKVSLTASGSISAGPASIQANLTVINPTRREIWRRRLVYALRWIWGTHNA